MLEQCEAHYRESGRGLLGDLIADELVDGRRILYAGEHAVAYVPVCARYPYEVWIAPIKPVAGFSQLSAEQRSGLARALKTVLLKYDGLWQRPFPYLMAWYQAPLDGRPHPEWHLHAEFYPPYRTRGQAEVPGRHRDRSGVLRDGCAARGQGARTAARRGEDRVKSFDEVFGGASPGNRHGARPGQPAGRAHGLQRRLRAADRHRPAHARRRSTEP